MFIVRRKRALSIAVLAMLALGSATAMAQDRGDDRGREGRRGQGGGDFGPPPPGAPDGRGRRFGEGGPRGEFRRGRMGGGFGEWGRLFEPDFVRRDLTIIDNEFDLGKDQASIVEVMLLDYESTFAEGADALRERMREMRPQRQEDDGQRQERRELLGQIRQIREEARAIRERAAAAGQEPPDVSAMIEERLGPLRQRLEELRPQRPDEAELERMRNELASLASEWEAERDRMRMDFMAGTRSVLDENQLAKWPGFERLLRREKTLGRGRLSGERENLFRLVEELGPQLDEEHAWTLAEALEGYAIALDQALVARNEFLDTNRFEIFGAMRDGEVDRAMALIEQESMLRVAVREVNERYVDVVAGILEDAEVPVEAEAFRRLYRERAFARVFRPTRVEQAFDAAKGIEDIDEEILAAILGLEEQYLVELSAKNARLVETMRTYEPKQNRDRVSRWAARMNDEEREPAEDPIRVAFDDRDELGRRFRAQLESMLTPEQKEQLPAAEPERRQGERGFRGPRGGPEVEQRRQRMLERFDTDGDGEISEAEREAIRRAFREGRFDG